MGSATKPTQHDRWSNLSKRSPQLRGGSRRGPEAKNTPTLLCQDPPQFCEFSIEHGRHKKEATGRRGGRKLRRLGAKRVSGTRHARKHFLKEKKIVNICLRSICQIVSETYLSKHSENTYVKKSVKKNVVYEGTQC